MSKIDTVERLAARLIEAEAEALATGTTLATAESAWSSALATGDAKAEGKATVALTEARQARDNAVGKLPLIRQALTEARKAALPERFDAAEPVLDAVNARALEAAEALLRAHDEFLARAAELSRLESEHRAVMTDLRQHVADAGHTTIDLPDELLFPVVPGLAMAGRTALQPLRISPRTIYRPGRQTTKEAV